MSNLEYKLIKKGTLGAVAKLEAEGYRFQTVSELMDDRCQDGQEKLQHLCFHAANGNIFFKGPPYNSLYFAHTTGENNLIIQPRYIKRALTDLPQTGIFRPDSAGESWDAIYHESTERFALKDLDLTTLTDNESYLSIPTDGYRFFNEAKRRLADAVGFNEKNLAYLRGMGVSATHILFPSLEYLSQHFEKEKDPFWRSSWLNSLHVTSGIVVCDCLTDHNSSLRGVRGD